MAADAGRGEYVEPPTIYDVVELPSAQKFKGCQLWPDGESRCDRGAEYVFVYAASNREDDDRRRNAVACGDCCPKVSSEAKRDSELATDGGRETTHIDEDDGLWIPPRLREFEGQVVFRTPRTTIQHFESGGGQLDAYYGMVDERDFGDTNEMTDPKNPGLAPRTVSIKPQGEDPVKLTVSFPQEQLADGAGEPDSINEFALAGDFGFMRVEGPFEVDKSGTNWTIFLPEDPDNRVVRTLDEDDEYIGTEPEDAPHPNGKNPGDILEVPVKSFPEAHFAVYPPELVEDPIKASCPPTVCAACGTPYERVVEDVPVWERDLEDIERDQLRRALKRYENSDLTVAHLRAVRAKGFSDAAAGREQTGAGRNTEDVEVLAEEAKDVLGGYFREFTMTAHETGGFQQVCDCETDATEAGVVLDPFAGAGTTALVAKNLGRRFVGIDLNPEYVAMAQKRVGVTVDEPERLLEDDETSLTAYADGGGCSGE